MMWLTYAIAVVLLIGAVWYLYVRFVYKHLGRKAKEANMNTKWYSSLYENHGDAIISVDQNFRIIRVNKSATQLLGSELQQLVAKPIESIVTIVHRKEQDLLRDYFMRAYCGEDTSFEATVIYNDGKEAIVQIFCMPFLLDDQTSGSHFVIRDVTEEHRYIHQIQQLAYKDELTGLSNRRKFYEVLEQAMGRSRQTSTPIAVMLMDLDGFKQLNDTVGHLIGDRYLQQISQKLLHATSSYRSELARLGGDEFVIVLEHDDVGIAATALSEKIIEELQKPIMELDNHAVTISIGIGIYPDDKLDMMELIKAADEAMYAVKSNGKNGYQFYRNKQDTEKNVHIASKPDAEPTLQQNRSDTIMALTQQLKDHSYKSTEK